jgi:hypothetical protein
MPQFKQLCLLGLSLVLLAATSCSKSVSSPTPIPIDQLPAALEKAFAKAKPAAKDISGQVVASLQAKDFGKAYFSMQSLYGQPGLNKEQINVTTGGLLTLNNVLMEAQAKGDAKSAEALKFYRENK